jgi:hypothetical protein
MPAPAEVKIAFKRGRKQVTEWGALTKIAICIGYIKVRVNNKHPKRQEYASLTSQGTLPPSVSMMYRMNPSKAA